MLFLICEVILEYKYFLCVKNLLFFWYLRVNVYCKVFWDIEGFFFYLNICLIFCKFFLSMLIIYIVISNGCILNVDVWIEFDCF